MSKYGEIVALLDWAMAQKKKETDILSSRPRRTPDAVELLQKKIRERDDLEQFLKDLEKVRKKEDKKDDKGKNPFDKLSTPQLAILIVLFVPIYMALIQKFVF